MSILLLILDLFMLIYWSAQWRESPDSKFSVFMIVFMFCTIVVLYLSHCVV